MRKGFVERAELNQLLMLLPRYMQDPTLFGFLSTWRRNEVFSLQWADVSSDTVYLHTSNSKERESRSLPITGEIAAIIGRARKRRRGPLVFHHKGKPITDFRKCWATATKRAGLTGKLFHDLRRSGIRALRRAGVSEATAMQLSGHKTNSMFLRYSIVNEEEKREALEKVAALHRQELAKAPTTGAVQ